MAKHRIRAATVASNRAFHELNNNFAAIGLWVAMLLESTCEECRAGREKIAAAIGRNLAQAQVATQSLRGAPPSRGAATTARRRRRAG
jgi:hypothetical protein